MKKWLTALLLTLLMICAANAAFALEATDITGECKITNSASKRKNTMMTDKKYTSYWESNKVKNPYVQAEAPKDQLIGGVYVCFGSLPESWEIQVSKDGKKWETVAQGPDYYHAWVPLPEPARYARMQVTTGKNFALRMNEIFFLGVGDKPDWVQDWQPTVEKADIMFISTHPDDELIFFGGAIPTYAVEQGRNVVVAYYTRSNSTRSSELLNALWYMGVRNYPVIGTANDQQKTKTMAKAYTNAGGKSEAAGRRKVNEWVVGLYRQYKPEVVVTHDINGEYGHGMHMMISDAAYNAIALAANEDEFTDSTVAWGTWEVKKFYRHLWPENQIKMDWSVPLVSMGGATGLELADSAYVLFHKTQEGAGFSVPTTGTEYDNTAFGLVHTTVGPDVNCDDFLENIDLSGKPVETVPVMQELPAWTFLLPETNERGFLDEGEFIYSSEEEGLWIFVDETCKIVIERKFDPTQPLTWFECEIWTDIEQGEMLRTIWNDDVKRTKVRKDAAETAKKHNVVFATNTDYFTYRVDVKNGRPTGVVVRNGEILYDDGYPTREKADRAGMPNLDMVAFMEDGSLNVYRSDEISAQELVDLGAYDVYSFGPYLMKDGKLSQQAYDANDSRNPRCALGMVEPGHYVYIMVEGRLEKRSQGITMRELAKLMRAKGCENAINLDGGQTAVLIFMGQQLNKIGSYDGGKTNSRPTCEVMGVGYSEQVGSYELK